MAFYNGVTTQVLDKVGFRLKGHASRRYVKKTFKLSFSKFVTDRKWAQQKKLELKAMQQDVSALKEGTCLDLLYSLNAPAQRYGYAELFINGQSMGAYLMLESLDDQFLDSRLGNDKGAFYKCRGTLEYLGMDPELYRNATSTDGDLAYGPENEAALDYTLLRDLIRTINATDRIFVNSLRAYFFWLETVLTYLTAQYLDVDLYARTLAFEVMTGNWDGLRNANNYFLYYNKESRVFQYLRHDVEISFGIWNTYFEMALFPVYTWGEGARGYRLINRFLATQPFRGLFTKYCHQLIAQSLHPGLGSFLSKVTATNQELRPLIRKDQWRFTDLAFSYDQFLNFPIKGFALPTGENFQSTIPAVRTLGIEEFLILRVESALSQLDSPM